MSNTLFLVAYQNEDFCDDTSEILEQSDLSEELYEKLKSYLTVKEILETQSSAEKVKIQYIKDEQITEIIKDVVEPMGIKKSEELDKRLQSNETEKQILSLGVIANALKLLVMKRDIYKNKNNVLIMVA